MLGAKLYIMKNVIISDSWNFLFMTFFFNSISIILKPETCNKSFMEYRFQAIIWKTSNFINAMLKFLMGYFLKICRKNIMLVI